MPASDALEAFPRGAVPACYVFGFKFSAFRYCIGQKLIVESKSNNCNELSLQKHRHQSICKRV